jgi:uncharacterized RDD family membrane protein YckC
MIEKMEVAMVTPQLLNYVSQMRLNKKSDAEIQQDLVKSGWAQTDIATALEPQPAPTSAPVPTLNYQGIGNRMGAMVIDFIITFVIMGYVIAVLFHQTTRDGFNLSGIPAIIEFILIFVYFILMELFAGATVGKMVFKLKVVKDDGSKADFRSIAIRNLLRIVDFLPMFYLVGAIIVARSDKKQRFGDKIAHTVVIKS